VNVNKLNYLLVFLAIINLIAFFYTKGSYYFFYIISMVCFILYFLIRKELFLLILLFSLGALPVLVEYIYGDFGKNIFAIFLGIYTIWFLIRRYKEGHNIWY